MYSAAWASLDWLNKKRFKNILNEYLNLENAWKYISPSYLQKTQETKKNQEAFFKKKKNIIPEQEYAKLQKYNISLLCIHDEYYPPLLKEIFAAPIFLYYKGTLPHQYTPSLAIVGTRKITHYGQKILQSMVPILSKELCVVSGLAFGVDVLAHKICLESSGKAIAILGGGLNSIYPQCNTSIAEEIIEKDGILFSEFPPETQIQSFHFPRRNRIIAGMSLGTLIIEAEKKSGSLITARMALEQNREVFSIPGSIYSAQSNGTNSIIQKGEAKLITSAEDIFEELTLKPKKVAHQIQKTSLPFMSDTEAKIYESLNKGILDMNQICEISNIPLQNISAMLTIMEIKGFIKNVGSGMWSH